MSFSLSASANDGVSKVSRGPQVGAHLTRRTDETHYVRLACPRYGCQSREGRLQVRRRSRVQIALAISARACLSPPRFLFFPFGRFGDFSLLLLQSISRGAETGP